ncbi:5-formyltetrahydrofolate cyclo-ligase [Calocera viscosa TUFC12733]|uniref:5-formyltetrahydrofolate cyclo-ligase n=1 Tax=Calocera viscosa (strain TUFC12733) TaxID=1330018 RepID=A0A167NS59_CALVF|nr:5-formyltetrahydrofolate cyclo-ligase [Calocera viscosa TUFC12733]
MSTEEKAEQPDSEMPQVIWTHNKLMKRILRAQMKEVLDRLSPQRVQAQSEVITHNVLRSTVYKNSTAISCYLTMEKSAEVITTDIVKDALASGKKVFVPRINKDPYHPKRVWGTSQREKRVDKSVSQWMSMLRLYSVEDMEKLVKNRWGIPEPNFYDGPEGRREDVLDPATEGVDLVLMPGVAFDRTLSRLGHGMGFYDKWLASYAAQHSQSQQTRPVLMGLALTEQVVEKVPVQKHDWPLDILVSPEGILPE